MGKFDGIYFVSDLDGTLLDNRTNSISEENIASIKYFMEEGGLFGFATGRIVCELEPFNKLIGVNAPCIACNGSKIYDFSTDTSRIIDCAGDDILPFLEYIEREYPETMIEMVSDDTIYYFRPNTSLEKHRSITKASFREAKHFSVIPHPWVKIALWAEPDKTKQLAGSVDKTLLGEKYNFMYSFEYCCEISTMKADKGVALTEAKKLLPNVKTVISIGDNENDILMLKNADISFVPANAVPKAKAVADFILQRDCNHNAVSELIESLDKRF